MCELFVKIQTITHDFAHDPFCRLEIHSLKIDRSITTTWTRSERGFSIVYDQTTIILKWRVVEKYLRGHFAVYAIERTERDPVSGFLLPAVFHFSPPTTLILKWQRKNLPSNDSVDLWTGKQLPTHFSSAQTQA